MAARVVHESSGRATVSGLRFPIAIISLSLSQDYYDGFLVGHKVGFLLFYDGDRMVELLRSAGFSEVTPNEVPRDDERGHIKMSAHNDPRNTNGKLTYASLIVDAVR